MIKAVLAALLIAAIMPMAPEAAKECGRVEDAGRVMKEIMNIPDDIPKSVIGKAECVVVLPSVVKLAFVLGASYGRGLMTCRSGPNFKGPWGAPTMMALEGGSFGVQLGGQATDFVLLLMNDRAASSILTSKVKLGADASVAAGPVGRNVSAETDLTMHAEVFSYSRARGLFFGISLAGSTLRPDNSANTVLYGAPVNARDIVLFGKVSTPDCARVLIATLNQKSPKNLSGE
jgi:lipid-binding SYLF domain-containing protein